MDMANYIRALRGPLLLITLGILFLVDHREGMRISQSWPILVVVFGVVTLAERLAGPRNPQELTGGPRP